MRVLFIFKQDLTETGEAFRRVLSKESDLFTIDLREEKDYDKIVREIEQSDRVISW